MIESKVKIGAGLQALIEKNCGMAPQNALIKSIWEVEHWRDGKLLNKTIDENIVTEEGLDALLSIMFKSGTQITAWYCAIFDDDYTVLPGDDYAAPGYSESSDYTEANRPGWTGGAVASQSVDNSASKATFTMNTTTSIYGGSLVGGGTGADTKGDTAGGGTLYCSAQFAAQKDVVNTDVLKVTVTLTSADV